MGRHFYWNLMPVSLLILWEPLSVLANNHRHSKKDLSSSPSSKIHVFVSLNVRVPWAFETPIFLAAVGQREQGSCYLSRGQVVKDQSCLLVGGVRQRNCWMSWESALSVKQLDVRQEHLWAQSSDACCGCGSWARCRRLQDLAKVLTHPCCLSSSQQNAGSNFGCHSRGVSCIFQFSEESRGF